MFEKKRGKRFLASVMALVMLLSLAPIGTLAASGGGELPRKELRLCRMFLSRGQNQK